MDENISSMSKKVKLLSVKVKPEENADSVKARVLKFLKNVEKANGAEGGLFDKSDCDYVHFVHDLDADSVLQVVSNSNYIGFLLKDGRVCRMRCTSRLDVDSRSNIRYTARPSFQVQSDAEYAKQLQAEYNTGEGTSTLLSRGYEELDWMSRGILPTEHSSPDRDFYLNLGRPLVDQDELVPVPQQYRATPFHSHSPPPRSPPPSYDALNVDSSWTLKVSSTEAGEAKGKKKAEKGSSWPDLGDLEWIVIKQVQVFGCCYVPKSRYLMSLETG